MKIQVAESVGTGHPDKLADIIADTILERALKINIDARVALEVLTGKNLIVVAGEVYNAFIGENTIKEEVQTILREFEYPLDQYEIKVCLKQQSNDIKNSSWNSVKGLLTGDQASIIGYACNDVETQLPAAHEIARQITQKLDLVHIEGAKRDSKCMVVIEGRKLKKLLLSVQHGEDTNIEKFKKELKEKIIFPVLDQYLKYKEEDIKINNSERFVIGGLDADTGVTNRKLMVDTYGTVARNGGGGLHGKDLSKVDRLGAYYARWICKNFVYAHICEFIELELIYEYGQERPTFILRKQKSNYTNEQLLSVIKKVCTFSFKEIYERFNIKDLKFSNLARYGHFRDAKMPWEHPGLIMKIMNAFKSLNAG